MKIKKVKYTTVQCGFCNQSGVVGISPAFINFHYVEVKAYRASESAFDFDPRKPTAESGMIVCGDCAETQFTARSAMDKEYYSDND